MNKQPMGLASFQPVRGINAASVSRLPYSFTSSHRGAGWFVSRQPSFLWVFVKVGWKASSLSVPHMLTHSQKRVAFLASLS